MLYVQKEIDMIAHATQSRLVRSLVFESVGDSAKQMCRPSSFARRRILSWRREASIVRGDANYTIQGVQYISDWYLYNLQNENLNSNMQFRRRPQRARWAASVLRRDTCRRFETPRACVALDCTACADQGMQRIYIYIYIT